LAALGFIGIYLGAIALIHGANGFFMNWNMVANQGEGWEYFILLFGLAIIVLIKGGGKASIDAALAKK
jgi:putative oxidoreductase